MSTPLQRIRIGATISGLIVVVSVVGFWLSGRDVVESVYMVVITIAGVGFTENPERTTRMQLFVMGVIVFGMSAAAYTIGGLIQMMTEGEVQKALGQQRMTRGVERLNNHIVLCGYGRNGQVLAQELAREKLEFVVVESEPDRVKEAKESHLLVVAGNATEEDVLVAAGVKRASAVITSLPNDAANVFITLTP